MVPVIQVINAIRGLLRDAEAAYRRGDVQDGRVLEAHAWRLEEELEFRRRGQRKGDGAMKRIVHGQDDAAGSETRTAKAD